MSRTTRLRDDVRRWLEDQDSEVVLFSDLTRGVSHRLRLYGHGGRDVVRETLRQLQADGLVSLSPTPNRLGRPGVLITIRKDH